MTFRPNSTDEELIAGCCAGQRLAQRYLYERYAGRLLGIPMRYTGDRDEALSLFNQAFLKILRHLPDYQPTGPLGGWMACIVFNTCIDHVRSRKTYEKTIRFPEHLEPDGHDRNLGLERLDTEEIYRLIQELPSVARSVFCLYVIDGYRHKEIGEMLGMEEATARWHLSQARKTLQARIRQLDPPQTVHP